MLTRQRDRLLLLCLQGRKAQFQHRLSLDQRAPYQRRRLLAVLLPAAQQVAEHLREPSHNLLSPEARWRLTSMNFLSKIQRQPEPRTSVELQLQRLELVQVEPECGGSLPLLRPQAQRLL